MSTRFFTNEIEADVQGAPCSKDVEDGIGPRPELAKLAVQSTLAAGKIRDDLNRLSIVLALLTRSRGKMFDALLAADTDADGFQSAMLSLKARTLNEASPQFDAIKVSHHGSLESHNGSDICKHKKPDIETVAAISAGAFDVLPDREVLNDFLQHGWTVLLTTKRTPRRHHFALELSGRPTEPATVQTHDLRLKWSPEQGISWEPIESRVAVDELPNYQTAST